MLEILIFSPSSLFLLDEHRQQPRGRRALRAAERVALEILDGVDAAGLLGDDRERRLVPDHVDHDRRILRLGRGVLDDGVDVAEAGVIGARHDARHRGARALALVDHDVEAFLLEVAVVLGIEERGVAALRLPAQRELDRRFLRHAAVPANRATPNSAALTLANIVISSTGLDGGWRKLASCRDHVVLAGGPAGDAPLDQREDRRRARRRGRRARTGRRTPAAR